MKISDELRKTYKTPDPESDLFFEIFDEPEGSKILEVGAQHSPISSLLAKSGFRVWGVDLKDSDQESHENYTHVAGDFCKLPNQFYKDHFGTFDCIIAVSAIEHFGLKTYGEQFAREYYDVTAMRYIYDLLKTGGVCYLVVPYGGKHVEVVPHWRVYSWASFTDRLVQDFIIEDFNLKCTEKMFAPGRTIEPGELVDWGTANMNTLGFPHIGAIAKLRK